MSGYLVFISGKYQGREFPLPVDSEIMIGRSSQLDLVLEEDVVSRRHARVTCHDDKAWIEDLDSTHGIYINGERVTNTRLHDGDRILIGTNIMRYSLTLSSGYTQRDEGQMVVGRPAGWGASSPRMFYSAQVPLVDVMQLFTTSHRTCTLCYVPHASVKIYIKQGLVHWATFQDEPDPYIAFARILATEDAMWTMDTESWDGSPVVPTPLDVSLGSFIMTVEQKIQERAERLTQRDEVT